MARVIDKLRAGALAVVTGGGSSQVFLGAPWIAALLRRCPASKRAGLALRLLALSPHYFRGQARRDFPSRRAWLSAECERNRASRQTLCALVVAAHLTPSSQVLDIGCGPGFLARAMAPEAGAVWACDVSDGVLACARILNAAPNVTYFNSASGFGPVANASLDLAVSFAVFQHLREAAIRMIVRGVAAKLRPGGRCLFLVQLEDPQWGSKEKQVQSPSLAGRLRLRYGLNFFPRPLSFYESLANESALSFVRVLPMTEFLPTPFDSIYYQHLIEMAKPQ